MSSYYLEQGIKEASEGVTMALYDISGEIEFLRNQLREMNETLQSIQRTMINSNSQFEPADETDGDRYE